MVGHVSSNVFPASYQSKYEAYLNGSSFWVGEHPPFSALDIEVDLLCRFHSAPSVIF